MKKNFILLILITFIFTSCSVKKTEKVRFNSSIEVLSQETAHFNTAYTQKNEREYYELQHKKLRIKNSATNKIIQELELTGFSKYAMPAIAPVNDSIVYLAKSPDGLGSLNSNLTIFFKVNINTGEIIKSIPIDHPQFILAKGNLKTSPDSTICAEPVMGFHYHNEKLYFPLFRWIPMSYPNFFKVKIPIVAYYDLKEDKVNLLDIYVPKPVKNDFLNTASDARIQKGHGDNLIIYFPHTDTVIQYNMESRQITKKVTPLPLTKNTVGIELEEVAAQNKKGIFDNKNHKPFKNVSYDAKNRQYWRFGKVELSNMSISQKNDPIYGYAVYDTTFQLLHTGILPSVVSPYMCAKSTEKLLFYSSSKLKERKLFHVELSKSAKGSYQELKNFEQLSQAPAGWSSYFKNIHQMNTDTVRALVVPEYSCPSCVMAVLTRDDGINAMNKYGYSVLMLSSKKYVSKFTDVQNLESKITTRYDSYQHMSYLESFSNPKLIVIVDGKVVEEKYLNPDASHSLETIIQQTESKLASAPHS